MSEIQQVSTGDLKAELLRRTKELQDAERSARLSFDALVCEHIDTLLLFVPQHSKTTCSDDHLQSDTSRCKRCLLLSIKNYGWVDGDYTISIDVTRRHSIDDIHV